MINEAWGEIRISVLNKDLTIGLTQHRQQCGRHTWSQGGSKITSKKRKPKAVWKPYARRGGGGSRAGKKNYQEQS